MDLTVEEPNIPSVAEMNKFNAQNPVAVARFFELSMQLFFLYVLGVRSDSFSRPRKFRGAFAQNAFSEGGAFSSSRTGIFSIIAAYRGDIEDNQRGNPHPHCRVWTYYNYSEKLLRGMDGPDFKDRVRSALTKRHTEPPQGDCAINRKAIQRCSAARSEVKRYQTELTRTVVSWQHSSVHTLPKLLPQEYESSCAPLPFTAEEQELTGYDGGEEIDGTHREHVPTQEKDIDGHIKTYMDKHDGMAPVNEYNIAQTGSTCGTLPLWRKTPKVRKLNGSAVELHVNIAMGARGWRDADNLQTQKTYDTESYATDYVTHARRVKLYSHVHNCTTSCYKYNPKSNTVHAMVCRYGCWRVIVLEVPKGTPVGDLWKYTFRRKGKALVNNVDIAGRHKEETYGQDGKIKTEQHMPKETPSNPCALICGHHNVDIQNLTRLVAELFDASVDYYEATVSDEHVRATPGADNDPTTATSHDDNHVGATRTGNTTAVPTGAPGNAPPDHQHSLGPSGLPGAATKQPTSAATADGGRPVVSYTIAEDKITNNEDRDAGHDESNAKPAEKDWLIEALMRAFRDAHDARSGQTHTSGTQPRTLQRPHLEVATNVAALTPDTHSACTAVCSYHVSPHEQTVKPAKPIRSR